MTKNIKTIKLKPVKITQKILNFLEKRKLIRTLRPTKKILELKKKNTGGIDNLYVSSPKQGAHKLLCVVKDDININLSVHTDNEEVILINTEKVKFRPLILIIGLYKNKEFEKKAKNGNITKRDIVAVSLEYNKSTSVFTILKDTPHCEVTLPGKKAHPVFYVTEPSEMKMKYTNTNNYKFELDT